MQKNPNLYPTKVLKKKNWTCLAHPLLKNKSGDLENSVKTIPDSKESLHPAGRGPKKYYGIALEGQHKRDSP